VSEYGRSKLGGERVVRESGVPWTIIRPSSVYGPGDTAFLLLFKSARFGIVPLVGDSDQELSLVHIDDLTDALTSATASATERQIYFACHREVVTSKSLARAIHGAVRSRNGRMPGPLIVRLPRWATRATVRVTETAARLAGRATMLSPDKRNELMAEAWTCSPAALERDTGWRAQIPLSRGLTETAHWYREHGWL
jgi:nucleoside-diphosphate-sugar epimerase